VLWLVMCDTLSDAIATETCALMGYYPARVVIVYRCFGTKYGPMFKGQEVQVFCLFFLTLKWLSTFRENVSAPSSKVKKSKSSWACLPLNMGQMRCPETSVNNYHTTLRNILEGRKSHQYGLGSVKSRLFQLRVFSSL
jgi:hypothetical protein